MIIKNTKRNEGQAMVIIVIFFVFISTAIISGLMLPSVKEFKITNEVIKSKKSYFLAESGIEDALYRILTNKTIGSSETISIDSDSATTEINNVGLSQKEIVSTGDSSSFQRKINLSVNAGVGVSFNYGVQVGQGGVTLNGSSGVNGNVYANGPITGSSSTFISGSAISANSPSLYADQSHEEGQGYFIQDVTTKNYQDIAQSFRLSTSMPLNKVSLNIKKISSTYNAHIKIVNDLNGSPGSTIYATAIVNANKITSSYNWVDFSFSTNPLLEKDVTYWLVFDYSISSTKYYSLKGTTDGAGYPNGIVKQGSLSGNWYSASPSDVDLYFKIYLGGFYGSITGSSGSIWNQLSIGTGGSGIAHAHTVNYTEATGSIYCQTGTGNNKSCDASEPDPSYISFPVSDGNILQWKNEAEIGGVISGDYTTESYGSSLIGPKKITGNLNVTGSHTLYVVGTLWVQGNVTVSGSSKIVLHSSYGNNMGVVVSDGWLNLSGSGQLNGSGQAGSYLLFVTTSNCDASFCPFNAINISGAAGSVVLNAQNGTIYFSGSASAKEEIGRASCRERV